MTVHFHFAALESTSLADFTTVLLTPQPSNPDKGKV